MTRYDLNAKVALVTGGRRGIGFATARALVARGAQVAIVDLDGDEAQRSASAIHDTRAVGFGADVTDRWAMERVVAATVERFGGLDVVVANAGIVSRAATLRAMSSESCERVLDVNLMGVYRTVDVALPEIVANRGHVVVISSIYAFMNGVGTVPYAMSKAAVEQLGRALRVELAQHGASASVAYFGLIDTELLRQALDHDPLMEEMAATIPKFLRKRLDPKKAGEAIVLGIERRKPRIILPRRWGAVSVLRGVLNPLLDARMESDSATQAIAARLDERGGEEQPTTR
ncbi:MAG: short-chain dehydrogenase/reductase [Solirubrobacterales bacterium]|nr:short-chain dehydrogenase/reductase [Solirubrobacterales bacterium]